MPKEQDFKFDGWGKLNDKEVILIDFDGTICPDGYPGQTEPFPGAKEALDKLAERYLLICFSSRLSNALLGQNGPESTLEHQVDTLRKYFKKYKLPIYAMTGEKIPAKFYIDNRALEMDPDFDWDGLAGRILNVGKGLTIALMTGFPGTGKSTFSENYEGFYRVALDVLKKMTGKDVSDEVFWRMERELIKVLIADGKNVIVDRLNLTKSKRSKYITLARKLGANIWAIKSDVDADLAIKVNKARDEYKRLKDEDLERMIHDYEEPSYEEGFDKIILFKPCFLEDLIPGEQICEIKK